VVQLLDGIIINPQLLLAPRERVIADKPAKRKIC